MSVRGLPKGQFRSGGGISIPPYGSVEFIDAYGPSSHNDDVTVSSMNEDEFTFIVGGVSGNSYMYSIGFSESDIAAQGLGKQHVSDWVAMETASVRPYPDTAGTHNTDVQTLFGSANSPGWCRARFRMLPGFQCASVAYNRHSTGASTSFAVTPSANPMSYPGGLLIAAAYKEDDAGYWPNGATGTGWTYAVNGTYSAIAYYMLSTTEIENPGSVTFSSPAGAAIWGGVTVWLR
jgi:hypothetical protein